MKSTRRYRNLLTALAVSVALNFILGIVASVAYRENSQRFPRLARLFDFLAAPSNAIADRLAPSGHEAAHFMVCWQQLTEDVIGDARLSSCESQDLFQHVPQ
jgi:hypothetical protein